MTAGQHRRQTQAFTLIEVLVSVGVVVLLVGMLAGVVQQTSSIWRRTTGKIEQFRETRAGFESMTTRLSQATLNTYWDYNDANNPRSYVRRSELRFISGPTSDLLDAASAKTHPTHAVFFDAPLGMTTVPEYRGFENLLCTWGYYIEYADDSKLRPAFITERMSPPRYRYRLMELSQPSEQNPIYRYTSGFDSSNKARALNYLGKDWFRTIIAGSNPPVHDLAENVIALIITPRLSPADEAAIPSKGEDPDYSPLAPNYLYDSSPLSPGRYGDARVNPVNQLPPILQVTMVAIDEAAAQRMNFSKNTEDPFNLEEKFKDTRKTTEELLAKGGADSLEHRLTDAHLNYRIFTTNVVIRGAKWSRDTTN